jgi:hypothetical protein
MYIQIGFRKQTQPWSFKSEPFKWYIFKELYFAIEVGRPDFCGLGSGSGFIIWAQVFAGLRTLLTKLSLDHSWTLGFTNKWESQSSARARPTSSSQTLRRRHRVSSKLEMKELCYSSGQITLVHEIFWHFKNSKINFVEEIQWSCCHTQEWFVHHLWEMAAVLRELLFQRTKRLPNTRIAGAILTYFKKGIKFIYTWYDVNLYHVVLKTFHYFVRNWLRMT